MTKEEAIKAYTDLIDKAKLGQLHRWNNTNTKSQGYAITDDSETWPSINKWHFEISHTKGDKNLLLKYIIKSGSEVTWALTTSEWNDLTVVFDRRYNALKDAKEKRGQAEALHSLKNLIK